MAINSKIVKKANSFLVLDAIRKHKHITIEGIIDNTGLSRPTVLSIIKKLLTDGVVSTYGLAPSDGGRQPMLFTLTSNSFYAIGIDVDGPPINLVVADLYGNVVYSCSWKIMLTDKAEMIVSGLIHEIDKAITTLNIDYSKIIGIGIGLPAVIDIAANTTVRLSRLSEWNNYPISEVVSQHTGVSVHIRNDAHLISIAEHSMVEDAENSLYIVHRSGIGMSAILGNQIYEGATGNSGYIGHSTLIINGKECDCGARGCFEAYCSKRAIVKDYQEMGGENISYEEILQRATQGEKLAIQVLESAGELFGVAVANFIKSYEIYTVILGDMMCNEKHLFFRSIVRSTKKNLNNFTNKQPRIVSGKLTSDNFGLGGAHFVLSKFFARPKLRLQ
jgi:predicted NBD/HSP70 family sugar kinase